MSDESQRLISADNHGEEGDAALRPKTLDGFIGQKKGR